MYIVIWYPSLCKQEEAKTPVSMQMSRMHVVYSNCPRLPGILTISPLGIKSIRYRSAHISSFSGAVVECAMESNRPLCR